jgi:Spy/CpxP family protein refolding chaperone
MKETLRTFLLTSVFAASLLGQGPRNPPNPANMVQRRINFLTTFLSLASNQQTEATTILTSATQAEAVVGSSLRTARQSLADAVTKNDTNAIDQASATIGNLTAQLTSIEAKADAAFYQILTPDQQTKLSLLKGRALFGGGPGGPGPGRPER